MARVVRKRKLGPLFQHGESRSSARSISVALFAPSLQDVLTEMFAFGIARLHMRSFRADARCIQQCSTYPLSLHNAYKQEPLGL